MSQRIHQNCRTTEETRCGRPSAQLCVGRVCAAMCVGVFYAMADLGARSVVLLQTGSRLRGRAGPLALSR